jgi:hypothetical protein
VDLRSGRPVFHVLDHGSGIAHVPLLLFNVYSECGRRLYLNSASTRELYVARRTRVMPNGEQPLIPERLFAVWQLEN